MRHVLALTLLLSTLPMPTTAHATLPAPPPWLAELDALYDAEVRVAGLGDRTFAPEAWWAVATPLATQARGFRVESIGQSAEGRPLRYVSWGQGDRSVLLWSQMHGDESTASMAIADLFNFLGGYPAHPLVQRIRTGTTLHFLPVMNPDGAARFQRRNAQGIDINRDARARATPEGQALHALRERLQPDFGFNLHDQDVGTRAGESDRGTAIALLAPAYNEARDIDAIRGRAIEVSVVIRAILEPYIAGHIAKWDDTFNPRAFGDLTAAAGVSTILIESGGIEGDLHKQQLRKLNFLALVGALDSIATGAHEGLSHAPYLELPENADTWPDLLVKGGTLAMPGLPQARADVVVNFEHPLLERGGIIEDIGDMAHVQARRTIDATGLYIVPLEGKAIAPGSPARFRLVRDPEGSDVAWTLAGDVDPAHPAP
ncbi:MAG TPA: M14 family zinc carboxypeptidase [Xanthomonadaceae bacterium]|nr:M14 family zinc carboxypeptidase [Xanthomonadaceae bacterium]